MICWMCGNILRLLSMWTPRIVTLCQIGMSTVPIRTCLMLNFSICWFLPNQVSWVLSGLSCNRLEDIHVLISCWHATRSPNLSFGLPYPLGWVWTTECHQHMSETQPPSVLGYCAGQQRKAWTRQVEDNFLEGGGEPCVRWACDSEAIVQTLEEYVVINEIKGCGLIKHGHKSHISTINCSICICQNV